MSQKSRDVLLRSDRVLVGALAIVLAAASAAVGAAAAYRPHTDKMPAETRVVVARADQAAPLDPALSLKNAALKSASEQLVMTKLMAEHRCLSEALYYEARGEGIRGQKAVAEVVFHRMETGNYGHSICAVVYEGANRPGCQFSFTCDGELAHKKAPHAWMESQVLAAQILTGEVRLGDETDGATSYHAVSVQPDWANDLIRTVQIGNHIFYRAPHSRAL